MSDPATLNARAKGLGTRLLSRAELEQLAALTDVGAVARALGRRDSGLTPAPLGPTDDDVERAVRRGVTKAFGVLARWAESPDPVLEVFFAELERRDLRALLRGAIQGAAPDLRLGGLIPTPGLPERALSELARLPVTQVVGQLLLLERPEVIALQRFGTQAHPPLFEVETALLHAWAERVLKAARRGDENLRTFVAEQIDALLMRLAVLLAAGPLDVDPGVCFVKGGRHLTSEAFVKAAHAGTRPEAAVVLDKALAQTPLAALAAERVDDPARMETAALRRALVAQRRAALADPLGSAPVLRFLLRLDAQSRDLLRIAHGAALAAPASLVQAELVTPWS